MHFLSFASLLLAATIGGVAAHADPSIQQAPELQTSDLQTKVNSAMRAADAMSDAAKSDSTAIPERLTQPNVQVLYQRYRLPLPVAGPTSSAAQKSRKRCAQPLTTQGGMCTTSSHGR